MSKNSFRAFIATLLLIVLVLCVWVGGHYITGTWDVREWGKQTEQENNPDDENDDDNLVCPG